MGRDSPGACTVPGLRIWYGFGSPAAMARRGPDRSRFRGRCLPDERTNMNNTRKLNRRRFLQQSAALSGVAGAGLLGVPHILAARSPSEKLGIAVIGCGGQGSGNPGIAAGE